MNLYKELNLAIVAYFVFFISPTNGAQEASWEWGTDLEPRSHQVAVGGGKKCELKNFPLLDLSSDSSEQASRAQGLSFLGLTVPFQAPTSIVVDRTPKGVNFRLTELPVLTYVVNEPKNLSYLTNPSEKDMVEPIDIRDARFKAHGVLVSLFRGVSTDASGKAGGKVTVGTAYLVSPHCLITAAHNVVLNNFSRKHIQLEDLCPYAERVEFWPLVNGFTSDMFDINPAFLKDGATRATAVKLHHKWDPQGHECDHYDIAVLKLSSPIGYDYGSYTPRIVTPSEIEGKPLFVSGYPAKGNDTPFILTECAGEYADGTKNRAYYKVEPETQKGQSGSGVRVMMDGRQVVVGTHTAVERNPYRRGEHAGVGTVFFQKDMYEFVRMWVTDFES